MRARENRAPRDFMSCGMHWRGSGGSPPDAPTPEQRAGYREHWDVPDVQPSVAYDKKVPPHPSSASVNSILGFRAFFCS